MKCTLWYLAHKAQIYLAYLGLCKHPCILTAMLIINEYVTIDYAVTKCLSVRLSLTLSSKFVHHESSMGLILVFSN